jgi:hypothetical protein
MTEMIRKTYREVFSFVNYKGVCHDCNSPQTYSGVIIAIVLQDTADYVRIVPVDVFTCGTCGEYVKTMMIYKNLEVTKELSKL